MNLKWNSDFSIFKLHIVPLRDKMRRFLQLYGTIKKRRFLVTHMFDAVLKHIWELFLQTTLTQFTAVYISKKTTPWLFCFLKSWRCSFYRVDPGFHFQFIFMFFPPSPKQTVIRSCCTVVCFASRSPNRVPELVQILPCLAWHILKPL